VDVLGIDVGKRDLHATLLQEGRAASKSVANSETGIAQLQTRLKNRNADRVHACLEATGGLHDQREVNEADEHDIELLKPRKDAPEAL